jgi:WD40 repeat protein
MATNPQEYALVATFSGVHKDSINKIKVSPGGRYVASASEDGTIATYDLKGGLFFGGGVKPIRKYISASASANNPAISLCWGRDTTELYVGFLDGVVRAYRRPTESGVRR